LNAERVRIAHGLWYVSDNEGRLLRASRGKGEAKVYFQKAGKLAQLADRANQLRFELEGIVSYLPPIGRRSPKGHNH
jgi:hypothetical protein